MKRMAEMLKQYVDESKEIISKFATNWEECSKALIVQRYSAFGCDVFKVDPIEDEITDATIEVVDHAALLPNTNIVSQDLLFLYNDLLNSPRMKLCENGLYMREIEMVYFSEFKDMKDLFLKAVSMPNNKDVLVKKSSDVASYLNYIFSRSLMNYRQLRHGFGENGVVGNLFFSVELKEAVLFLESSGFVFEQGNALAFVKALSNHENYKILDLFENIFGGFDRSGNILMKTMIDKRNDRAVVWLLEKGLPPKIKMSKLIPGVPWKPRVSEVKEVYFFDYAALAKDKLDVGTMNLLLNAKERHLLSELIEAPKVDGATKMHAL